MSRALRAALGDRQMHLEPERAGVLHRPHRQLPCDAPGLQVDRAEGGQWRRLTSADETRFFFTVPRARQRYRPDAGVDRFGEAPRPIGRALPALVAQ
ncbi:hypothetical protein [Xanthomonas translucens]|uniref:hypothetical protein n=2 Tax=Xanthomonas campestris pv. translucens TaxID=343 RepID=UPI000655251F|nr:hypothetical protein [Xanthomonas translucens]AKK66287.1 hypothetical protein FD63_01645 [Xanthomonas translucens pv. undulosa]MBC3973931.1 hypothetical protein [Xanthomonas translucens pv. undulosa]MCT8271457.1 hypothetical protein [Xanthomonas translucens pv. undulosa]MCT8283046.1 hypothetical protein [Xanthomonas translucens pv. undulosa]MCT8317796.1 hypothetical protein [Xanthomonas translucens pv. undulosa]